MIEKWEHWTITRYSSNVFCFTWSWYYECFTDGFRRGEINVCAIIVIYCHCEKATVPDSVSCKHPFPWICLVFLKLTFPIKYSKIKTCAVVFFFMHSSWVVSQLVLFPNPWFYIDQLATQHNTKPLLVSEKYFCREYIKALNQPQLPVVYRFCFTGLFFYSLTHRFSLIMV